MKFEQLILSFVAVVFGLFVAGVVFFIYQSTKTVSPDNIKTISIEHPSPTPSSSVPLNIDTPNDEDVVSSKSLTISGKTDPKAVVIVTTDTVDNIVTPTTMGAFSLTITLPSSENILHISAVMPDGTETEKTLTVSYTTEDF
ncbi:MAG TPA: hypothetical protein VF189_04165 [Patescibacteria group bacterium]